MYNEASNVFYMENLFIRASVGSRGYTAWSFDGYPPEYFVHCSRLPILSCSTQVLACKRHVMELNLHSLIRKESHDKESHFIFACDDLARFSRTLVWIEQEGLLLNSMQLSIIIGDEVGTVGEQSRGPETPTDGNPKELMNAAKKNAAAGHKLANDTSGAVDESNVLTCEHMKVIVAQ